LPVHAHAVLMTVDGDGVQRELVSRSEDTNGDFTTICNCRISLSARMTSGYML
jgi:hypothetical protein